MTESEMRLLKKLLAKYLDMQCQCGSDTFEDRHVVTCAECGVVKADLTTLVGRALEVKELMV